MLLVALEMPLEMPDMKLLDGPGFDLGALFSGIFPALASDLSTCFLETELPFLI